MKSVRTRIMTTMCILIVASLLIVASVSVYLNVQTTNGTLEQTMQELAKISAKQVSNHIRSYKIIVESSARDERIFSPSVSPAEKQAVIDEITGSYDDLTRGNILDANGDSIFDDNNYSDREYFKKAKQGLTWISEPLISKVTGKVSLIIAAPIWEGGLHGTTVTGVLYLVPTETFLDDIVSNIKVSPGAGAQIINKVGTVIAHPNHDLVLNASNAQENEKTDSALKPIAALEREMMAGKTGFGTYSMFGVEKFLGYAPIEDSDGWSLGVNAPISDFMGYTYTSITVIVILFILSISAAVIISVRLANSIGKPLKSMTDILSNVSETGNVNIGEAATQQTKSYLERKDEIGLLAQAADSLVQMLTAKVSTLDSIAGGDLTTEIACRSEDDAIGNALTHMTANLNNMFTRINGASMQVSNGASQIANGSQALAQGSVEQSASVEELSASMSDVSEKTSNNARMAKEAAGLSDTIKHNAQKGSAQMEQMMQAVKDINEASNSIGKVMKAIDDIAFQTNILALNAAVEAARAGQHGKGFAVVADEVRSLAAKSAEAAKDTGSMISNSIEKSNLGYQIATETSASLQDIVGGIDRSAEIVDQIASLSEEQAVAIDQINKGIEQVAQVVQQNSATAEQSAAASQEMSDQSNLLQQLIAQFKIKQGAAHIEPLSRIEQRIEAPAKPAHFSDESGFSLGSSDKY